MSTNAVRGIETKPAPADMKFEVVIIPVADADRAKTFYANLGWRLDADFAFGSELRVIQFTPPGSGCSVQFGKGLTSAAPGAGKGYLVVSDIVAARDQLIAAGVKVGEFFHVGANGPVGGLDPERRTYQSRALFSDPDGNGWVLQEVTTRLPGRIDSAATTYASASDLANAMRRAEAAHGEHEKRTGKADANWPDWYASYMVAEEAGTELPQ
ncbi:MAG: VOC family protein [Candidatus Acidiferrales bacterium]|jgi:catechol 2,3-dioxygenase-like lactoylglutathione lyase family enzyme